MDRNTLLIVDSDKQDRTVLRSLFERQYDVLEAESGSKALQLIKKYRDSLLLILLELDLPEKSGFTIMDEMSSENLNDDIPVIAIVKQHSEFFEDELYAFDYGATDIIRKPFEPHIVKRRIQNTIELRRYKNNLEGLVKKQETKLRESNDALMNTLSSIIEHRSAETGQHVLRIRMFIKLLLEDVMRSCPEYELNDRVISIISRASALHDIGKIAIPDAILNKPGKLTDEEFAIMKTHTLKGCEILEGLDGMDEKEFLQYAYNICRYHHERWDGGGYPDGLKGENIPICAQATGIADAYDALTTDRVYKKAISPEAATIMILNGECGTFSPKLLECFKNIKNEFAELTRSYADSTAVGTKLHFNKRMPKAEIVDAEGTLQLIQTKYSAMLRYIGATAIEADLDSGIYHFVYSPNDDFEAMKTGENFSQAMYNFAQQSVHPDDKSKVLDWREYINSFTEFGEFKRTRKYRVYHRQSGEYIYYSATTLRLDIRNPKSKKVLLVWREMNPYAELGSNSGNISMMQGLLVSIHQCVHDNRLTILDTNQGFISVFGYNKREIEAIYHNSFIEMIYPPDRRRVLDELESQLQNKSSGELEYRIINKDGEIVWVLDKFHLICDESGKEYINCVLVDMTNSHHDREELRIANERYKIIFDQTNDIVFEYDIPHNRVSFSQNWDKEFGRSVSGKNLNLSSTSGVLVHPDDIDTISEIRDEVSSGALYCETEVRLVKASGKYGWYKIRATTQFDNMKRPVKAIGVIVNIDNEKRRTAELTEMAERDLLTGLYNKAAARARIQKIIENKEPNARYAMMLIDIDNFKYVNDTMGHMYGDTVLGEISTMLGNIFTGYDILSRFGGDEFFAFVRIDAVSELEEKESSILRLFNTALSSGNGLDDCNISCSIGVAIYPDDANDFNNLFEMCDRALYHSKQAGKNCCTHYSNSLVGDIFNKSFNSNLVANTRIESDDLMSNEAYVLMNQLFHVLHETSNVNDAVQMVLEIMGKRFDVSRVYIIEDSSDGKSFTNTFEWCNDGIPSEIEMLQNVSFISGGKTYKDNFDEHGVFYCYDISEAAGINPELLEVQGIKSMLQCAMENNGKIVGFIGFDDCVTKRRWVKSQIDALKLFTRLITLFLYKKRVEIDNTQLSLNMRKVLENQDAWIYVINSYTYDLKFYNDVTKRGSKNIQINGKCYEVFFNRSSPCEVCPARDVHITGQNTMELFNSTMNKWLLIDASYIKWDGEDCCLLSSSDITKLKQG